VRFQQLLNAVTKLEGRTSGDRPNGKCGVGVLSDLILKCTEQIGGGLGNVNQPV
jgi:hypothetical protein